MYFRIYKAFKCIIMDDSLQGEKYWRDGGQRLFNTPFAGMSVLLKDCFCLTLINIHHGLYNCCIHICYKYCLNE